MQTLNVSEIFHSIQGESTYAGNPTVFVRLQGCNMRCVWCDTDYSLDVKEQQLLMTIDEIIDQIEYYNCKYVCITGGEPMMQKNILNLLRKLSLKDYKVSLETNGSYLLDKINRKIKKIIDFKCPDSGMNKKNNFENVEYITKNDEVKFVIASRKDYDWSKRIIKKYDLNKRTENILMSVVFGKVEPKELAEWILSDSLPVKFQLQLHKFIWEPNTRGV